MLILAGVSINAIVGENGLLTKTQYATFLNEMSVVEEAVQLWKAGEVIDSQGNNTTAIPTNGMCKLTDLDSAERLKGEIGYYRVWSLDEIMPSTSILSPSDTFNTIFGAELIAYPAGIQDLYYLNTDEIEVKKDKKYLVDAATGIVYSMDGISLKGISCYSSSMAKAVMNGDMTAPNFAAAEVSGSGSGEKLAGNVQSEYLEDGTKNPNYNPNGFKIISDSFSNNVYKLYNNGDLYGKGVCGSQLATSEEKMNSIANNVWTKFTVPSEIGSYKKIIQGHNAVYVIDSNDYLWAWGTNASNKFGLTQDQQTEFTGRDAVKLDIDGKKVVNAWDTSSDLFVLTKTDNVYKLYGCGRNDLYHLGLGHADQVDSFQYIEVPNPQNIVSITGGTEDHWMTWKIIRYNDGTFCGNQETMLYHGAVAKMGGTIGNVRYKYFLPIFNGNIYDPNSTPDNLIILKTDNTLDIDQDIEYVAEYDAHGVAILKKDGTLWSTGTYTCYLSGDWTVSGNYAQFKTERIGNDVKAYYPMSNGYVVLKKDGTIFAASGVTKSIGLDNITKTAVQLTLPHDLEESGIKEIYTGSNFVYYLSNNNILYGSSSDFNYLGKNATTTQIVKLENTPDIDSLYASEDSALHRMEIYRLSRGTIGCFLMQDKNGNIWSIGNNIITQRNNILQTSWTKLASDVKDLALGYSNSIAYVDKQNNLYVAGNDARMLGLNIEEQKIISSFTKVNNELINNNVKKVYFGTSTMYVLTNSNELYATGVSNVLGVNAYIKPGWGEDVNKYDFVKLDMEDVSLFSIGNNEKLAVADNKVYTWGRSYFGALPAANEKPTEWNVNSVVNPSEIDKIWATHNFLIMRSNDGKMYLRSERPSNDNKNTYMSTIDLSDQTSLIDGEKIIDVVGIASSAYMILTEDGNVYGWGYQPYLGLNTTTSTPLNNITKLGISNVSQITAGNGFFIAVKEDGSVWGTGTNTYGTLGRWVGSPRGARYRTAFEWVECPDLEI